MFVVRPGMFKPVSSLPCDVGGRGQRSHCVRGECGHHCSRSDYHRGWRKQRLQLTQRPSLPWPSNTNLLAIWRCCRLGLYHWRGPTLEFSEEHCPASSINPRSTDGRQHRPGVYDLTRANLGEFAAYHGVIFVFRLGSFADSAWHISSKTRGSIINVAPWDT